MILFLKNSLFLCCSYFGFLFFFVFFFFSFLSLIVAAFSQQWNQLSLKMIWISFLSILCSIYVCSRQLWVLVVLEHSYPSNVLFTKQCWWAYLSLQDRCHEYKTVVSLIHASMSWWCSIVSITTEIGFRNLFFIVLNLH